jgi:hypothetical protein
VSGKILDLFGLSRICLLSGAVKVKKYYTTFLEPAPDIFRKPENNFAALIISLGYGKMRQ